MPGYDRTGPMGAGPMTGGARGSCNPANIESIPDYTGAYGYGRGMALKRGFRGGTSPGRCRGFGRGYRRSMPAASPFYPAAATSQVDRLKADAEYLRTSLDAINKRIEALCQQPVEVS
jgi:hypothetical protein